MKVGITGGAGFIGGHICDELVRTGHMPVVFDRVKTRQHDCDQFMLGDVRDKTSVFEMAASVDAVIHLAAVLGTQETIADPMPAAETNILGMVNVLAACRLYKIPVVYAGVGNFQMMNTYSTTKTAAERLLRQYVENLGLVGAVVRPMNAYGPRQKVAPPFGPAKVRKIAPAFICRALTNQPIEIYGDGTQISDMIYVKDVALVFVRAVEQMVESKKAITHPIEVGPSESITVRDVANEVIRLSESKSEVVFLPMRPGEMSKQGLTIEELREAKDLLVGIGADKNKAHQATRHLSSIVNADTSTLEQVSINPSSFVTLESGMSETIDWYRSTRGKEWQP